MGKGLIILHRHHHLKGRDTYCEEFFAVQVFHFVEAVHAAHFCTQVATAYILVVFTGLKRRLHPHHSFTLHFTLGAIAVKNMPVTAVKFYRE